MKEELRQDYQFLWDGIVISDKIENKSKLIIDKILNNKNRYLFVSGITNVPWFMISIIHALECSLNFNSHLHNGDPLTNKTTHVPSGRPLVGNPPYSWEASAVDALMMKVNGGWPKEDFQKAKNMDIASILYLLELYNGMGYRKYHPEVKTPYLWSGTNRYTSGKYVEDGKFDPNSVSSQLGAAVLLKKLIDSSSDSIIIVKKEPIQLDKISKEKVESLQKLINDIASESWGSNFKPLIVDGKAGKNTKDMFNSLFGVKVM